MTTDETNNEEGLVPFGDEIWTADGPPVPFYHMPYPVRMTVIRLPAVGNGEERLFIHSPIKPTPHLLQQVVALGEVAYIVSPNKIHHLYLGDWGDIFPDAEVYASPGLLEKRPELSFDGELGDAPEYGWADHIDQLIFSGSRWMDEVVFFHKRSKTLILADLIENFEPGWFTGWRAPVAWLTGIVAPNGKAPVDFRLSFWGRKDQAAKKLARIKAWQPDNIIIAHGTCFKGNGRETLERAFAWVGG